MRDHTKPLTHSGTDTPVQVRVDGKMFGVHGPVHYKSLTPQDIFGIMGWEFHHYKLGGKLETIIYKTLEILASGKSVKLTSSDGWSQFSPFELSETDYNRIPESCWNGVQLDSNAEIVKTWQKAVPQND